MVLHAVTAHGHALEYAADELKDDEEIAVGQDVYLENEESIPYVARLQVPY